MPNVFAVIALIFLKIFISPAKFSKNFKVLKTMFNGAWQITFAAEIFFGILLIISIKMANILRLPKHILILIYN